jgi:hypothetical protein
MQARQETTASASGRQPGCVYTPTCQPLTANHQPQVRGMWGLLDMMDNYVTAVDAHMVVMGSQHLTSNDFNYVIGSITLSAVKRLHVPVLVVTANSRSNVRIGGDWTPPGSLAGGGAAAAGGPRGPNGDRVSANGAPAGPGGTGSGSAPGSGVSGPGPGVGRSGGGTGALRCLSLVENHARNMLSFLCTRLLDNKRGDRMLLAQVLVSAVPRWRRLKAGGGGRGTRQRSCLQRPGASAWNPRPCVVLSFPFGTVQGLARGDETRRDETGILG